MTDFVPKSSIPLKTPKDRLVFAQSIANAIFGEEKAKYSPAVWEDAGCNERFNLHPFSNDWWLHPPNWMTGKFWRLHGRYSKREEERELLARFAESFAD